MRKHAHIYAIAVLVAMPVVTDSAYERWSGSVSRPPIADETISSAKRLTSWSPGAGEVLAAAGSSAKTMLADPIDRARDRVTMKPFGMEIHPGSSPVPQDKFDGIHVGVDFETFEEEKDVEVPVYAVCEGRLQFKAQAKGYGGVAVQECVIDDHDVSVIYGHLDLARITIRSGQLMRPGDRIGVLGEGYSEETDGVRKHLHLGIRERVEIDRPDIRGYVKNIDETSLYLDALLYLPQ